MKNLWVILTLSIYSSLSVANGPQVMEILTVKQNGRVHLLDSIKAGNQADPYLSPLSHRAQLSKDTLAKVRTILASHFHSTVIDQVEAQLGEVLKISKSGGLFLPFHPWLIQHEITKIQRVSTCSEALNPEQEPYELGPVAAILDQSNRVISVCPAAYQLNLAEQAALAMQLLFLPSSKSSIRVGELVGALFLKSTHALLYDAENEVVKNLLRDTSDHLGIHTGFSGMLMTKVGSLESTFARRHNLPQDVEICFGQGVTRYGSTYALWQNLNQPSCSHYDYISTEKMLELTQGQRLPSAGLPYNFPVHLDTLQVAGIVVGLFDKSKLQLTHLCKNLDYAGGHACELRIRRAAGELCTHLGCIYEPGLKITTTPWLAAQISDLALKEIGIQDVTPLLNLSNVPMGASRIRLQNGVYASGDNDSIYVKNQVASAGSSQRMNVIRQYDWGSFQFLEDYRCDSQGRCLNPARPKNSLIRVLGSQSFELIDNGQTKKFALKESLTCFNNRQVFEPKTGFRCSDGVQP